MSPKRSASWRACSVVRLDESTPSDYHGRRWRGTERLEGSGTTNRRQRYTLKFPAPPTCRLSVVCWTIDRRVDVLVQNRDCKQNRQPDDDQDGNPSRRPLLRCVVQWLLHHENL